MLLVAPLAHAHELAPRYRVTNLTSGSKQKFRFAYAEGINNKGEVIGSADGRAFLWRNGKLSFIKPPRGNDSCWARDINDDGQVVGFYSKNRLNISNQRYFYWHSGEFLDLGLAASPLGARILINNNGRIVMNRQTQNATLAIDTQIVSWYRGVWKNHGNGCLWSFNDKDQIVGNQMGFNGEERKTFLIDWAAIWDQGLPANLAGGFTTAIAINNRRDIILEDKDTFAPESQRNLFLLRNHERIELGKFNNHTVITWKMNDRCQIVGVLLDEDRAMLWQNGMWSDLNDLIPPNAGWFLEAAFDINERGQIVGTGTFQGQSCAYLLTPLPSQTQAG